MQPLACVRTKKILWVLFFYPIIKRLVEKKCPRVFILVTSHQILVFDIKILGGQICKKLE
jgi:hypothetical protein